MDANYYQFRFFRSIVIGISLCLVHSLNASILPIDPVELPLEIESITVKMDKDRTPPKDSIRIKGSGINKTRIDAVVCIYDNDPNEPILEEYLTNKRRNGKRSNKYKGQNSRVTLKIKNDKFVLNCRAVDLTGLASPITLKIFFVSTAGGYIYTSTAYDIEIPPSTSKSTKSNWKVW